MYRVLSKLPRVTFGDRDRGGGWLHTSSIGMHSPTHNASHGSARVFSVAITCTASRPEVVNALCSSDKVM